MYLRLKNSSEAKAGGGGGENHEGGEISATGLAN